MRILCVTATYTPSINGVAISLKLLKSEIESMRHEFIVITPKHKNQVIEPNVYRLTSFPNFFQKDYPIPLPIIPPHSLKKFKTGFDIVFFHHPFGIAKLALYLAKHNHCPSVFFYHSRYDEVIKNYLNSENLIKTVPRIMDSIVKSIINKSNHIISETQSIKDVLVKNQIKTPITVISTSRASMYISTPKSILRKKYSLPKNKTILLCVSRLSKEKNLDFLVKAHDQQKNNNTILLMVGDGPEANYLKNISSINTIFLGSVPFEKMSEIYSLSDIFVFPSKTETQGIVVLEAMSAGLPIIAFNAPGPKDFVANNQHGLLANTNDEFLSNLKLIFSNKNMIKVLGNNAKKESEKYTLSRTAKTTIQLFKTVIHDFKNN